MVFVSTASQLEAFTQTLEKQKIAVFVTNPTSLEQIGESILTLGEIFDVENKSKKVLDDIQKRMAEVESKVKNTEKVKAFVQLDKSLYTIGKKSFLTDLLEKAGGESATADIEEAYPKISKERALVIDPEVIVLSDSPDNDKPNEVFKNSKAVKNDKILKINADILSRPGPRLVDALEIIAKEMHPEVFE